MYIIQVGLKCNHNCLYKRKEEAISLQKRKRLCDNRNRGWNNVVTSQGMQAEDVYPIMASVGPVLYFCSIPFVSTILLSFDLFSINLVNS